jgi:hypothetical protein
VTDLPGLRASEFARIGYAKWNQRSRLWRTVAASLTRGLDELLGRRWHVGYDADWDGKPAAAVGDSIFVDRIFAVAYAKRSIGWLAACSGELPSCLRRLTDGARVLCGTTGRAVNSQRQKCIPTGWRRGDQRKERSSNTQRRTRQDMARITTAERHFATWLGDWCAN